MAVVWVAGRCSYEVTGVIHLLKDCSISAKIFQLGNKLLAGDTLILCFSSAPLLGWWRYLEIIQWIAYRYDIRLIVLCPDVVYRAGIAYSRNTQVVNGKLRCFYLSRSLLQAILCYLSKERPTLNRRCSILSFIERASQVLQIYPSHGAGRLAARRAYYQRDRMVQHLGFISLLKLKIFMAGFVR